ncbi:MAG: cytochrome P450, partial [Acidimicrobiia bacterium]|nr:cytochrome P450 [Acidimicrobiia bacterium]
GRSFRHGFPHDFFTWARAEAPLYWHEPTEHTPGGVGFWVLSRHADALAVMCDPATFSSEEGGTQLDDSHVGGGLLLNHTDDPRHLRLRSLINRGFTPRMIGRLEQDLAARAHALLDAVPTGEPFDFVASVARELPLQAICSVLGVPQDDRSELADLVDAAVNAETGEVLGYDFVRRLGAYGGALIERKRAEPADDILSVIVHARLDDESAPPGGAQLSDVELKAFFNLLFPAGAETTNRAIAGGVVALGQHPEQLAALCSAVAAGDAGAATVRRAIEEILRWTTPSVYKRRTPTRDVELHGRTIRAGDKVTYWEMSANRDEAVFDAPFRFDIGRDPNPHVTFGFGAHYCLGANLARLELKVMLETLLSRCSGFEVVGEPTWTVNNRLVGMTCLPLVLHG